MDQYTTRCQPPERRTTVLSFGIRDLHLDGPARRISTDVECLDGLLEGQAVRDQRFDVDLALGEQAERFGILCCQEPAAKVLADAGGVPF